MNARSPGVVTWLGLAVVALAAAVLSFASLRSLAVSCGTTATLAWLLPVCIDAAAVVATRVWLSSSSPEPARRFARTLALGAFLLSVAGNAADHGMTAYGIVPPWWAVVAVAAVPPAILAGTAHLAALAATRPAVHQDTPADPAPAPGERQVQPDDLAARAAELVNAGRANGHRIGRGRLARELEVSESQARQLLRQVADQRA